MLTAGLSWREVTLLRAYAKYLRQGGMRFSQDYMQRVLRSNAAITRLLVRLFESRFDPARQSGAAERCEAITEEIRGELDEVVSLDHDRILRAYLAPDRRDPADELLTERDSPGGGARPAYRWCSSSTRAACPSLTGAAAEVRDVRLLAPAGSGAPAVRPGGARRAALVGPAARTSAPRSSAWSRRRR